MSTGKQNPLAAAEAADKRRKIAIQIGVAGVLVALVAAIGIGIAVNRSDDDSSTASSVQQLPATDGAVTESGTVRIGDPDAPVKVRVVADLQCPGCKQFEAANGEALAEAAANGTAVIDYQIISFLDRASTNQYSSRAANASFCVADADAGKYQTWLQTMFARQSAEGGAGLTNEQLVQIANEVGYTDPAVATCINDKPYGDYITQVTQETLSSGVESTPAVFINGELNQSDAVFTKNGLASVIADAAK
ncbi:DsbA family protein [Nocardia rhizosphaerae]|uniref:DsbA family protein n=1 Tax=Nocardia rhizosphaerae TaxID=1691571 RepID=A0ABV8L5A3_9NOCA